jgi:hypothetical protein
MENKKYIIPETDTVEGTIEVLDLCTNYVYKLKDGRVLTHQEIKDLLSKCPCDFEIEVMWDCRFDDRIEDGKSVTE